LFVEHLINARIGTNVQAFKGRDELAVKLQLRLRRFKAPDRHNSDDGDWI